MTDASMPYASCVRAWRIDPFKRSVIPVSFRRLIMRYPVEYRIAAEAFTVHPLDFCGAADILRPPRYDQIVPHCVHRTRRHLYMLWAYCEDPDGTKPLHAARFFGKPAEFSGDLVLTKHLRRRSTELPSAVARDYAAADVFPANAHLPYRPAQLVDLDREDPNSVVSWVDSGTYVPQPSFAITSKSDRRVSIRTLMYDCAMCGRRCGNDRCARCHEVRYCNAACQGAHWPSHRLTCVLRTLKI
jgi:hypothetical protein